MHLRFLTIRDSSTALTITNQRVLAKQGFLVRRTFEVPLTVAETLLGRTLGYGTVVMRGTTERSERFKNIRSLAVGQFHLTTLGRF
jgi:hypothetical protein